MTEAVTRRRMDRAPADIPLAELEQASEQKRFDAHPTGTFPARCVDIVDMGKSEFKGKVQHRLAFIFATDQVVTEGESAGDPVIILHYCTKSLFPGGEGRSPSKHITMLRECFGRPALVKEDIPTYTTGKLIGRVFRVTVVQRTSAAGRTYAMIAAFAPAPKSEANVPLALEDYYRPDWLHAKDVRAAKLDADAKDVFNADAEDVTPEPAAKALPAAKAAAKPEPRAGDMADDEPPPPVDEDLPADLTEDDIPF